MGTNGGRRPLVMLATCHRWPEVSASDRLYAEALTGLGARVEAAPWNSAPSVGGIAPFVGADAVVLRSNWDYHHSLSAFRSWLHLLEVTQVPVWNSPELVRWNLDKRYLLDLEQWGVRVPATAVVLAHGSAATVAAAMDAWGWERAVVKPAWGASGHQVERVERGALESGAWQVETGADARPLLVQEYLPEVAAEGEVALVFFGGEFSHAVRKRPAEGEFRVNSQYGGKNEVFTPSASLVAEAERVISVLPEAPLYARVDGVERDGELVVLEVEVNEPGLWLPLAPGAAERFAAATMARWEATRLAVGA